MFGEVIVVDRCPNWFDYVILDTSVLKLLWEVFTNAPKWWIFNYTQTQRILRILLIRCLLNSLWSALLSCPASVQLLGQRLLVMVAVKRAIALGGVGGGPSFLLPLHPATLQPVYPPLPIHLFFPRLPYSLSPEDAWFIGCHQLLPLSIHSPHLSPLSLSPYFPDPCRTKLSLRVSWADQRP